MGVDRPMSGMLLQSCQESVSLASAGRRFSKASERVWKVVHGWTRWRAMSLDIKTKRLCICPAGCYGRCAPHISALLLEARLRAYYRTQHRRCICRSPLHEMFEHRCLCGPLLVSSAGDAGCSESGLTEPDCWLILRTHKGCRLLWIAGRWP